MEPEEEDYMEHFWTVRVEATLSLEVKAVLADTEQEAIDQILGELPVDFYETGTALTILRTSAEEEE
jgi:hypothetical protein